MCLAIPAKIVELNGADAILDIRGVRREGNVAFIPDAKIGDYVLLHAGFAIQKWSEDDVREFDEIINEMEGTDGAPG
jgi:hydrogenase expression/formation protein HypC